LNRGLTAPSRQV